MSVDADAIPKLIYNIHIALLTYHTCRPKYCPRPNWGLKAI